MRQPQLLQYYNDLPDRKAGDSSRQAAHRIRRGLNRFKRDVEARYNEATLERLLVCANPEARQAAVLALGLIGSMHVNGALAARLHDEDPVVGELACDALWSVWFRADAKENNQELQRLMRLRVDEDSAAAVLAGFRALIDKAPRFAEAYNQRAIVYFRLGDWAKSIADCEKVLRFNPYHFGAASGLAQCFMKQKKLRAALRSYRRANRINPHLDGVRQVIDSLERMLGEKG
ncbi:MAG TPA: tetratricopeptide repeat protein [Gemmataceae bacterium]|nr:tetratricopeptide repeat protein [Gemmataceae bacterium]